MEKVRTDLALETREEIAQKGNPDDGILFSEKEEDGFLCSEIEITTEEAKKASGRNIGRYLTVEFGRLWLRDSADFMRAVALIARKIREFSDYRGGLVLVVGLGNIYITADAIGPKVMSKVIISRHLKDQLPELYDSLAMSEIAGIAPGVLGQTGVESGEIIKSLAEKLHPSLVIAVDALASRKVSRLATTIQITDTGIAPGSGVGNNRLAIDKGLVGCKVVSIGVPTVVDAATLTFDVLNDIFAREGKNSTSEKMFSLANIKKTLDEAGGNFYVTPKESDIIISEISKLIGYAINRAFYPDIEFEEMIRMVN